MNSNVEDIFENQIKINEKIEEIHLEELKGSFLGLIICQNGSRIMQLALGNSSYVVIEHIMREIEDKLNELMVDQYANYFCQKFYEYLKLDDRLVFLEKVKIPLFFNIINRLKIILKPSRIAKLGLILYRQL